MVERFFSSWIRLLFLALICVSGCDQTFEPLEPSDLTFSVFGYLDASADTQWIRVMPIRPLVLTSPEPLDARVILEGPGDGGEIVLRDSAFRYTQHNQEVGSEGVFLHNFWTTERVEPGGSYRFSATAGPGGESSAVVAVPPDYSVAVGLRQSSPSQVRDYLRVTGVEHLPFVKMFTHRRDGCRIFTDTVFIAIPANTSDVHVIPIHKRQPVSTPCGTQVIEGRELLIIASGAPWPSGSQFSTWGLGVPDVPSNIGGGVGFLGGVLTKLIPYEDCSIAGPTPPPQHCELSYDGPLVTVRGIVTDARCDNLGVADAVVTLEEIHPDPTAARKVRSAPTNLGGNYRISALSEGVPHALRVSHPARLPGPDNLPLYLEHADTLVLGPGERMMNVALQRQAPC